MGAWGGVMCRGRLGDVMDHEVGRGEKKEAEVILSFCGLN